MATESKENKDLKPVQSAPAEESDGAVTLTLRKPLDYNGHIYTELHFDFDSLTGRDSMEVEAEMIQRKKGAVVVGALNNDYIVGIAAKACKEPIGSDAFMAMSLKDYNRIKETTRNFLLK